MKAERLVIFCAERPQELGLARASLEKALEPLVGHAELKAEPGPESLSLAGWTALDVTLAGKGAMASVRTRLDRLAESVSKQLGDDVLCIYLDPFHRRSRACLQSPSGFPRSSEGDSFHVLRQAAGWVEADPVQLLRFFNGTAGALPEHKTEPDEDDRFVEKKLEEARELMRQYQARKPPVA